MILKSLHVGFAVDQLQRVARVRLSYLGDCVAICYTYVVMVAKVKIVCPIKCNKT